MKSLLIPMVTLSLVALAGDLWAVTPPAKIAYVEGTVLIKKKGDDKLVPAQLGESLFYGDQVKTLGGKCQVNMTASGILRLSPNTTALFPGEENRDEKISVMRMLKGKTEQNIENLWTNEVFEVRTPSLVAGTQDQPNTDAARVGYHGVPIIDATPETTNQTNLMRENLVNKKDAILKDEMEMQDPRLPPPELINQMKTLVERDGNSNGNKDPAVIPADCTIDLLLTYTSGPDDLSFPITLEIRARKVTAKLPETNWPAEKFENATTRWERDANKQVGEFEGRLTDNRIEGTAQYRSGPQNTRTWYRGRLETHVVVTSTMEGPQFFELRADGTVSWNEELKRKNHNRWLVGTGRDKLTDYIDEMGTGSSVGPYFGLWQFHK